LRIQVEESVHGLTQGFLDFFPVAFDEVHGDAPGFPVLERDGGFAHRVEIIQREQPHAINQRKLRHRDSPFYIQLLDYTRWRATQDFSCDCVENSSTVSPSRISRILEASPRSVKGF